MIFQYTPIVVSDSKSRTRFYLSVGWRVEKDVGKTFVTHCSRHDVVLSQCAFGVGVSFHT